MFGTGPTEFGRISSFSSCKKDLHKRDLLGSRRRLNDSWSQTVAIPPQLSLQSHNSTVASNPHQPSPSVLCLSKMTKDLQTKKISRMSSRKSNKPTIRPLSFLYLIPRSLRNGELLGRGESYATTSGVCVPGGSLAIGLLWGQSWSQGAQESCGFSIQGSVENRAEGRMLIFFLLHN